jgi:hypothetical protein
VPRVSNSTNYESSTSRPPHKRLNYPLAGPPAAEEFGEGGGGQSIGWDRGEEGEHRQALAEVDVLRLLEEADVPANGGAVVFLRLPVSEKKRQLERFFKSHDDRTPNLGRNYEFVATKIDC